MPELDEVWSQMLARAVESARARGRGDVADYLTLKAANDLLRSAGVKWLFDSFIELAAVYTRHSSAVVIERDDPFSFKIESSNIVGSALQLRQGVRSISIAAGWTRTPRDGVMRGGALAAARILHFGIPAATEYLYLLRSGQAPEWARVANGRPAEHFSVEDLRRHFDIFAG
jgi:hypothetical protein